MAGWLNAFRDVSRMLYASLRLDSRTISDGRGLPNILIVGVRWDWP